MRWYSHLYVGEKAGKRRFSIIQGIREGKLQPEVYVITPPQNGNNILDIYPAPMLLLPPYRDEERLNLQEFLHCSADGDENRNSWE